MHEKVHRTLRVLLHAGRTRKAIFLISHMRAYTSLLGHIIGSHPDVEGYYEMHTGYFSSRSLVKWKALYYKYDAPKKSANAMFDKLLHNRYKVSPEFEQALDCRFMVALREAEPSISSIMKLYSGRDDARASLDGAASYYSGRVKGIERFAQERAGSFFYYDAEALVEKPEDLLEELTEFLQLREPLAQEYRLSSLSGQRGAGDSSAVLGSGVIVQRNGNGDELPLTPGVQEAVELYRKTRAAVIEASTGALLRRGNEALY